MSASLVNRTISTTTSIAQYDVIILGAGPYGLSAATHLRAQGLRVAIYGKPLSFWREHMPKGMLLRSYWWATSLSDPEGRYSFGRYFKQRGERPYDPLPAEIFIDYGLWFQKQAVPDLNEIYITHIEHQHGRYIVTLEDGSVMTSRTVVMAPGLQYYVYIPTEYTHLPARLVSHSVQYQDLIIPFIGKRVAVIGAGQAALESAALLHEQGIDVSVIARSPVRWLSEPPPINLWQNLRTPMAGMGEGWTNWLLEKAPYALRFASRKFRDQLISGLHGPAGAHWLKDRIVGKVMIYEQTQIVQMEAQEDSVRLGLSNGKQLEVDHILLGTGYRAGVKLLTMLDQTLIDRLQTYQGSPILNSYFESNIAGLYFLGFSAVRSFGPYYRFVTGASASARRVTQSITRYAQIR